MRSRRLYSISRDAPMMSRRMRYIESTVTAAYSAGGEDQMVDDRAACSPAVSSSTICWKYRARAWRRSSAASMNAKPTASATQCCPMKGSSGFRFLMPPPFPDFSAILDKIGISADGDK